METATNTGLKDFWGNDAIDYGTKAEMKGRNNE